MAIKDRASDIHVEPFEKELAVRFRIDGVLYEVVKPPPRLQASIVSRVKIMAGLNIAEKRIPQDGRIRIRMAGLPFECGCDRPEEFVSQRCSVPP